MFIHLGGERIIRASEVIAIFDITLQNESNLSNMLASSMQDYPNVEVIGDEEPKSMVLTESRMYYSPISSGTLKKRAQQIAAY